MTDIIYIYTPYEKCQHFWHFMMSEFMPIVSIIATTRKCRFVIYNEVRIWNQAFDIFYNQIENNELTIELQNFSKNTIDNYINYDITNMKWDWNWSNEDQINCMKAVKWLTINAIKYMMTNNITYSQFNKKDIIIQDRGNNTELTNYFNNENIGTKEYGSQKRKVYDLDKLINILSNKTRNAILLYSDGKHIYEQIYPYIYKNNIILGHGAGMFFTLFMNKNAKIVEIIPYEKIIELNGAAQGLIRISFLKNFKLKRIILNNNESILKGYNIKYLLKMF